jgi:hypothetical protein
MNDTTLEAVAALNPVPPEREAVAGAADRDRIYARIRVLRDERPPARSARRRAAVAALAVGAALALPALAASGQLGSLFGFANRGADVDDRKLDSTPRARCAPQAPRAPSGCSPRAPESASTSRTAAGGGGATSSAPRTATSSAACRAAA